MPHLSWSVIVPGWGWLVHDFPAALFGEATLASCLEWFPKWIDPGVWLPLLLQSIFYLLLGKVVAFLVRKKKVKVAIANSQPPS